MTTGFRVALVVLTALILQLGVAAPFRVLDAMVDLVMLVTVAAAVAGGRERGALVGFAAGLAYDLLLTTPFGLSALAYCLVGYGVGVLQTDNVRSTRWVPVLTVGAASGLGVAFYALLGAVVGQESMVSPRLPTIMGVVAAANLLLGMPAVAVLRWALTGPVRHRVFAR